MRWLHGITDTMDMSLSKLWDMVKRSQKESDLTEQLSKNNNVA